VVGRRQDTAAGFCRGLRHWRGRNTSPQRSTGSLPYQITTMPLDPPPPPPPHRYRRGGKIELWEPAAVAARSSFTPGGI